MNITTTQLTKLDPTKSYYLSNTTHTIKEAGYWQRFKCWTGLGDGREKVQRLADAIQNALLADARIKREDTLSAELGRLNKKASLSGSSLKDIAVRFKAAHAAAIATSDACRMADSIADRNIADWVNKRWVISDKTNLEYIKKLCLYYVQNFTDNALELNADSKTFGEKISHRMYAMIGSLNSVESIPFRNLGYPKHVEHEDDQGKIITYNPPRFILDELHFRAILGTMVNKNGPVNSGIFNLNLFKLTQAELTKRSDVILDLPLSDPNKPGSGAAFAEKVANSAKLYNEKVLKYIKSPCDMNPPPASFVTAEDEVVAEMRARFGKDAISENLHVTSLMTPTEHVDLVKPLLENADSVQGTVNLEDVKNAIRTTCLTGAAKKVIEHAFKEIAKEMKLKDPGMTPSIRFTMDYPDLVKEIAECETPEKAKEAVYKCKDQIRARLKLCADAEKACKDLPDKAVQMIAKASGLEAEYVAKRLITDALIDKAQDVMTEINTNAIKYAGNPEFDVNSEFKEVLENFVKQRVDVLAEVDNIKGINANLKKQWKSLILSTYKSEKLKPAKIYDLVANGGFNDEKLLEALETQDTAQAAKKLSSYMGGINKHFVDMFSADKWEGMGNDEREPLFRMALMGVIDKTPAVAEKYLARSVELMNARLTEVFNAEDVYKDGDGRKIVENLEEILVGLNGQKVGE